MVSPHGMAFAGRSDHEKEDGDKGGDKKDR
jgi:hypothetical protein